MEDLIKARGFQLVLALLGVLIGVSTALFSFIQYKKTEPQKRELTLQVVNAEELTTFGRVPELTAEFEYFGEKVEHLWKIDTIIYNSGTGTLVGKGANKDLVEDALHFYFEKGAEILSTSIERNQPKAKITRLRVRYFNVRFTQWRPAEELRLSFLISSNNRQKIPSIKAVDDRELVGGQIFTECPTSFTLTTPGPKTLIEYLPRPLVVAFKILNIVVCIGLAGVFSVLSGNVVQDFFRLGKLRGWYRKYGVLFKQYLEGLGDGINISDMRDYLNYPNRTPKNIMDNFEGPVPPPGTRNFGSFKEIFGFGALFVASAFGLISAVFSFIPL